MIGITVNTSDSKAIFDSQTGLIAIEETVTVYDVAQNSLADGILKAGDILVSSAVNGKTTEITRQYHIIDMMLDVRVGDVVTITVLRDGKQKSVDIKITEECLTAY